ncbi:unknown [Alistipes sp. CAG:268]|nr:unknown [Alistipes sp. CAG:268]
MPRSEKTACVRTSREAVIEPEAESPSVMKIIDCSASSFLSVKWILQSRSLRLLSETFLAVSRAFFWMPEMALRSFSFSTIFFCSVCAVSGCLCR